MCKQIRKRIPQAPWLDLMASSGCSLMARSLQLWGSSNQTGGYCLKVRYLSCSLGLVPDFWSTSFPPFAPPLSWPLPPAVRLWRKCEMTPLVVCWESSDPSSIFLLPYSHGPEPWRHIPSLITRLILKHSMWSCVT